MASKIASIIGSTNGLGGTTPHMRTNKLFALLDRSSLSLTNIFLVVRKYHVKGQD